MKTFCPTCGQQTPLVPDLAGIRLSPIQTRIIEALVRRTELDNDGMVEAIWGDHPDGGPLTAKQAVSVHINILNAKIRRKQLAVQRAFWGQPYRLIALSGKGPRGGTSRTGLRNVCNSLTTND